MNRANFLKSFFKSIGVFTFSLLTFHPISFAEVMNSQENTTVVQNTAIQNSLYSTYSTAQAWQLTEQEWQRYQALMRGQNGQWYPQLTPPAILGINAMTTQEQKHFAQLVAQQEHDKVARELAFNKAVFEAMREMYVDEPIIRPFDRTPFNPIKHER